MKYIKLYEDFKVNNIVIDDVVKCIDKGGILMADIVKNLPNSKNIELKPLSIDEDGLITVEYDTMEYEVDIKNVNKIEW